MGSSWAETSDVTLRGLSFTSETSLELTSGSFQMHLWPRIHFTLRFAVKSQYVQISTKTTPHPIQSKLGVGWSLSHWPKQIGPMISIDWKCSDMGFLLRYDWFTPKWRIVRSAAGANLIKLLSMQILLLNNIYLLSENWSWHESILAGEHYVSVLSKFWAHDRMMNINFDD